MQKALVVACGDPRLNTELPKLASIICVDEVVEYRIPGPDGLFHCPERTTEMQEEIEGIRKRLSEAQPYDALALVSHSDCAEHPVSIDRHRQDTRSASLILKDRLETTLPIHTLIAIRGESDEDWVFEHWGVD